MPIDSHKTLRGFSHRLRNCSFYKKHNDNSIIDVDGDLYEINIFLQGGIEVTVRHLKSDILVQPLILDENRLKVDAQYRKCYHISVYMKHKLIDNAKKEYGV